MEPVSEPLPPAKVLMSPVAPTPLVWRLVIGAVVVALATAAYWLQQPLGPRGQAALGIVCFLGVAALFSSNLRAVSLQTLLWGIGLQIGLVLFIDKFQINGYYPGRE